MKKIVSVLIFAIIFNCGCSFAKEFVYDYDSAKVPVPYLMDFPKYKNITLDKIKALTIRRYTEAGAFDREVADRAEIEMIYNFLKHTVILGETKYGCTDNTTMYIFTLEDDSKALIEIECNWVVIDGKNYYIDVPSARQVTEIR